MKNITCSVLNWKVWQNTSVWQVGELRKSSVWISNKKGKLNSRLSPWVLELSPINWKESCSLVFVRGNKEHTSVTLYILERDKGTKEIYLGAVSGIGMTINMTKLLNFITSYIREALSWIVQVCRFLLELLWWMPRSAMSTCSQIQVYF